MRYGIYIIDGKAREYNYNVKDGVAFDVENGRPINRVWVYPVRQSIIGGDPVTRYFTSAKLRSEYMSNHDCCSILPRCKVPELG